jgi:N6-adenosine-specific RNA methylase IME4
VTESPNVVYGRLLEAAHFTGYGFERVCGELEWLLDEERWRQVGPGYDDVNAFLAGVDLSEFRVSVDQRKRLARRLAELEASQRQTARTLGVGEATIGRDLGTRAGRASTDAGDRDGPRADAEPDAGRASTDAPAWLDAPPADARRALEQASRREVKEREREDRRQQNRELVASAPRLAADGERFETIMLDPPWDWGDEGDVDQFGRATPTYATMPIAEIAEEPIGERAADDAHLYLWITNRSLRKGFALLDGWGFRYVTCLTWVKPSIGMGNYFRGSTEHVLFGVRGSLPLLRADIGTHFEAPRPPQHSQKPDAFYELVETCSPGPWFEWPARRERPGWAVSGAEVAA